MRIKHKAYSSGTDFLAALSLLRHDPDLLSKVLPQARAGNVHARYAAGSIYAEGCGLLPAMSTAEIDRAQRILIEEVML